MKNKILYILLVAVLTFASATPALADSPNPGKLDPNAQIGRVETFTSVTSTESSTNADIAAPAASGCKTYTLGVNGYSAVGLKVWSYAWNIQWCYNGSTITSLSKWRTVWANYGWSFKGDISANQSGGVGKSSYWHYAQGDFCFIETYTCITHSYPWVNQTVYGSGGYTGSAGGN